MAQDKRTRTERLEEKIGAAYAAVGQLADMCGLFDHPEVQKALDYFAEPDAPDTGWTLPTERELAMLRSVQAELLALPAGTVADVVREELGARPGVPVRIVR